MCKKKPKAVRLKLNFDGSSKYGESRYASVGAFGGVFRDLEGRFVLGYAGRIGNATSSVAELVALKRGLELALQNEWRDICIEGDCKAAVEAITSRVRVRASKDKEQFRAITAMLPRLRKVTVTHVGRKRNTVADSFAELGHEAGPQRVWRGVPPPEVLLHLRRDAELRMQIKVKRKIVK
ncbi:uncharacterized protein LOC119339240 [Triticum dicoccoides]|uniref:uncharacterized protein LOC119339240 n=1 Tax=Triticum dicoccoides TaxID=85692 RepID=UPI001891CEA5|nr:uncharacterized protein LOC119339240 [Triticum dicoccoides]XP_044432259.1 uncharacterized protein LOC123158267 [Triticum aestivum]